MNEPIKYIQIKKMCELFACSRAFIYRQLRDNEKFPRPVKMNGGTGYNLWVENEVVEYQKFLLNQRENAKPVASLRAERMAKLAAGFRGEQGKGKGSGRGRKRIGAAANL